jgi:hypothetical protein
MYKEQMSVTGTTESGLRALVPTLTAELPQIIAEVVELIGQEWPDYAETIAQDVEDSLLIAETALLRLVTIAERLPRQRVQPPITGRSDELEAFEEIGRLEWREGRSLAALLSAYRAGARVAWRRLAATAVERGLDSRSLTSLAEALFVFVEELSSASAHGYVDEQQATAAERERLRGHLADLLLSDRSDTSLVHAVAVRAGWPVPATAAPVLIDSEDDAAHAALRRLDPQCLPVQHFGLSGGILPDADAPGRRAVIESTLRGCSAVIGSNVPLDQLPASLRVTEAAIRLASSGLLRGDPIFVTDHYDVIMVARDPWLLGQLRRQVLSPLDAVAPRVRQRLEDTLFAWLNATSDQQAADVLHVHPQTIRYRLRQLREVFGPALDDPESRRRLMLALSPLAAHTSPM